jgi:hypothetical protein
MTKTELSKQIANYLISQGADPESALAYGDGFPARFSDSTMRRMKDLKNWDQASRDRLLQSFNESVSRSIAW